MAETLEQKRAKDAWEKTRGCSSDYTNLAKGLPALIMGSGLMQVMAFLEAKGKDHHKNLGSHLRAWLHSRFGTDAPADFSGFMQALMKAEPQRFQQITTEAFAWLKWVRQLAAARTGEQ